MNKMEKTIREVKDELKQIFPQYDGFIEHTLVATMCNQYHIKHQQSELKNNGDLGDVSESLSFEGMVINPIDKDGDFEITMNHYNNDAYHYLTTEQAKQLIVYLQQSLNSR